MIHHRLAATGAALLIAGGASTALAQERLDRAIVVTSPTLRQGEPVPRAHTPDGRNLSPALSWTGLPEGTKELAVHFIVLALDRAPGLRPGLDRAAFLRAADGHVLGRGELVAAYQRGSASP